MRDPVACLLAVAAALVLTIFVPGRALFSTAGDTDRTLGVTDPDSLYDLTIAAAATDLEGTTLVTDLRGTLVELDRADLEAVLRRAFESTDAVVKAGEVHRRLVRWVRDFPDDRTFHIHVAEEKRVLLDVLPAYLEARIEALEGCPPADDLGILWAALTDRVLGDVDRLEFLRELPHCRPPGAVRSGIVSGLHEEAEQLKEEARDSVEAFTVGEGNDVARTWLRFLGIGLRVLVDRPWIPLAALVACLAALAVRLRRDGPELTRLLALVFVGASLATAAAAIFLVAAEGVTLRRWLVGAEDELREATFRWMALVFHAVEGTTRAAGRRVLAVALVLAAAGLLAPWVARRSVPLDRRPPAGRSGDAG